MRKVSLEGRLHCRELGSRERLDRHSRPARCGRPAACQRSGRANHDGIAKLVGDQLETAEHERPHENLAQLGVCLNQREELFPLELYHLTGLARATSPSPCGR